MTLTDLVTIRLPTGKRPFRYIAGTEKMIIVQRELKRSCVENG